MQAPYDIHPVYPLADKRGVPYLGDRVIVNSLRERGGKVIIDMFVHRKDDCMAGPTKRVRNVYDYLNPDPDLIPSAHAWTTPSQ